MDTFGFAATTSSWIRCGIGPRPPVVSMYSWRLMIAVRSGYWASTSFIQSISASPGPQPWETTMKSTPPALNRVYEPRLSS